MLRTYTEYLWFNTDKRREDINITKQVKEVLGKSQIKEGLIVISTMHATAGLFIDDREPEVKDNLTEILEKLDTGDFIESNQKAQQKCVNVSQQIVIPVTYEKMDLGLWQQIFYAEFDGQRKKKIVIKVIGE